MYNLYGCYIKNQIYIDFIYDILLKNIQGVVNINLMHLKYAVEVDKTKSITQAAKNLYMGQPNLSKAIKELEKEIGITIFQRNAKGVEATEKGEEFLSYAKTIISQMDELESLYTSKPKEKITLNVAVPRATYITIIFTELISKLDIGSHIDIRFRETSPSKVVKSVSSGESSIGILRYKDVYEEYFQSLLKSNFLESELIKEYKMGILMSKDHPLANCEKIKYQDLLGYTELIHGDFHIPNINLSKINKDTKMENSKKIIYIYDRGTEYDLLKRVKGTYIWVSYMPQDVLDENNFVVKQCDACDMINKDLLIYDSRHKFNKYEKMFADMFFEVAKKI